ncbi:hypothetical protein R3P38DRAFT_1640289 [Favolaschia claudopus]|uniref:Ricin B lectin domain-containing protein n=1 Tax=Favolaschia claudopus TaxID=2862362 RepID=A0AAW0DM02_9AGAR
MYFNTVFLALFVSTALAGSTSRSQTVQPQELGRLAAESKGVSIVSFSSNQTIFTFAADGASTVEVLLPVQEGRKDQHYIWDRFKASSKSWAFQNRDTKQYLTINKNNDRLITSADEAGLFSVVPGADGGFFIEELTTDQVAQPIFHGAMTEFSEVVFSKITGSLEQRWFYRVE